MPKITIKATNTELTDAIRDYIDKRLSILDKYLGESDIVHAEIEQMTKHKRGKIFRAEIRFRYEGRELYAASEKEDIMTAIDAAREEIARETTSHKSRLQRNFKNGARHIKRMVQDLYK